tara:strand:- start:336 stop:854 length:519 start_codon:yes stop_codon:yes gene_type:complete
MARVPAVLAHPSNDFHNAAKEEFAAIPGWDTFTNEQQHFLMIVSMHKSQNAAAKFLGKSSGWLQNTRARVPYFEDAVHFALHKPLDITVRYMSALMPKAVFAVDKILTPNKDGSYDANTREVLQAAQQVFKMNGLDKSEADTGGNRIYAGSVNLFNTAPPEQAKIIAEEDDG